MSTPRGFYPFANPHDHSSLAFVPLLSAPHLCDLCGSHRENHSPAQLIPDPGKWKHDVNRPRCHMYWCQLFEGHGGDHTPHDFFQTRLDFAGGRPDTPERPSDWSAGAKPGPAPPDDPTPRLMLLQAQLLAVSAQTVELIKRVDQLERDIRDQTKLLDHLRFK